MVATVAWTVERMYGHGRSLRGTAEVNLQMYRLSLTLQTPGQYGCGRNQVCMISLLLQVPVAVQAT